MENRPDPKADQDFIFFPMHIAKIRLGSIVPPAQVQHAVKRVEKKLISQRIATGASIRLSLGDAYANNHLAAGHPMFSIVGEFKCQNIRGTALLHIFAMQLAHAFLPNQCNGKFVKCRADQSMCGKEIFFNKRHKFAARLG
jgi:hypothetical protein